MMRAQLGDPITLTDLAGAAHLSVYHFVRVFRQETGTTPYRFLTELRIEETRRLLRATELPLSQIAVRCGFAGPAALSAAFVRYAGIRPSAYRNSARVGSKLGYRRTR